MLELFTLLFYVVPLVICVIVFTVDNILIYFKGKKVNLGEYLASMLSALIPIYNLFWLGALVYMVLAWLEDRKWYISRRK